MDYDFHLIKLICDADCCSKFANQFRNRTIQEMLIRYENIKVRDNLDYYIDIQ